MMACSMLAADTIIPRSISAQTAMASMRSIACLEAFLVANSPGQAQPSAPASRAPTASG